MSFFFQFFFFFIFFFHDTTDDDMGGRREEKGEGVVWVERNWRMLMAASLGNDSCACGRSKRPRLSGLQWIAAVRDRVSVL